METVLEEAKYAEKSPMMTDRDAANYMKLSPRFGYVTVQRWARSGVLRGGKVGDHWRFRKEDLDDFVFSRK